MGAGQSAMAAAYSNCGAARAASLAQPNLANQHWDESAHRAAGHAANSHQQAAAVRWDDLWAETAHFGDRRKEMGHWDAQEGTLDLSDSQKDDYRR